MGKKIVIWFTGKRNVGKTTMANVVGRKIKAIILDGGRLLNRGERIEDIWTYYVRVIRVLLAQGHNVSVAFGCPAKEVRDKISELITGVKHNIIWVWLKRDGAQGRHDDFSDANLVIDTGEDPIEDDVNKVLHYLDENNHYRTGG